MATKKTSARRKTIRSSAKTGQPRKTATATRMQRKAKVGGKR